MTFGLYELIFYAPDETVNIMRVCFTVEERATGPPNLTNRFGVTELQQPFVKSNGPRYIGRAGIHTPIRGSLPFCWGVSGERPRSCRATDQCDEQMAS